MLWVTDPHIIHLRYSTIPSFVLSFLYYSGELRIPSHISTLHVEQEVVGDDTEATDSVLQCDEVRENLLNEEKRINTELNVSK